MEEAERIGGAEQDKDRNFVTALARGLEVLACFRANETVLTNTDFAERTGLPKATISRLTYTLCQLGYLVLSPAGGTYRLGAGVLQLGYSVLAGLDIADRAIEEMRALRDGPNSYITVALGEAHGSDVVYLAVQPSRENVSLSMRVGARLPLFDSAIGRALLVAMDEEAREQALAHAARNAPAGADIGDAARRAKLAAACAEYAARGFCTGYGDWRADVNGIAVPLRALNGSRIFGLNVGGPSFHVKKRQLEGYYAKELHAAARALCAIECPRR